MKTAVFQINEPDGTVQLVCVPMPTLHSACSLESWLRMQAGPGKEIKLLGRFDAVRAASNQAEAEALVFGSEDKGSENKGTEGRKQQAGAMLTVDEIVEKILLRAGRS